MTAAAVDLHCHVLPGVDDGCRDLEASLELARAYLDLGVHEVGATPHVRVDHPDTVTRLEPSLEELRSGLSRAGVALQVHRGAEVAMELVGSLSDEQLAGLTLGGSRHLLVEAPAVGLPLDAQRTVASLRRRGFVPVLAHVERIREVRRDPEVLDGLVRAGALAQVTTGALTAAAPKAGRELVRELVEADLVHLAASDAHGVGRRLEAIGAPLDGWVDEDLARWLKHDVPAALLADEPLPERPTAARRRRWPRRRSGAA